VNFNYECSSLALHYSSAASLDLAGTFGDMNFGTLRVTGKNNGNCAADGGYPTSTDPGD
jgi:hypothetical protein